MRTAPRDSERRPRQPREDRPAGASSSSSSSRRGPAARPAVRDDDAPPPSRGTTRQRRVVADVAPKDPRDSSPDFDRPSASYAARRPRVASTSEPDSDTYRTLLSGRRPKADLSHVPDIPNDPWDEERWGERDRDGGAWNDRDADFDDDYREARSRDSSGRLRAASAARPLSVPRRSQANLPAVVAPMRLSTASVPELAAYRQAGAPVRVRPRIDTQRLIQRARSPWSLSRAALMVSALIFALVTTYAVSGEPSQPLMAFQAQSGTGPPSDVNWPANSVVSHVQPFVQVSRSDLYDSADQFHTWALADCSAAVLSEVLSAYGVPNATIGHMIDDLGSEISPHYGLLDYSGFAKVAAKYGYRADIYMDSKPLTYKQMKYLTNTLGIPVIVNVRISYGYYHFFSGGHFLVMTAGDDQGVQLVDSSGYNVKYLPLSVFNSMFTNRTVVIVPRAQQYILPS
jgi:hypothetical protein